MIRYLKHIKSCVATGLFISIILFATASVFDKELSENYERASQACMVNESFDDKSDAVLTDAFNHDVDFHLFIKENTDSQDESTIKYLLLNINTKLITAYKHNYKTHLNLRPVIYSGLKIHMYSYYPFEEYPSIS